MSLLPISKPVAETPLASPVTTDWRPESFRNARLLERDAGPPELMIELRDHSQRPATTDELRGYLQDHAEEFVASYRNFSTPGADTLEHAPPYVVAMGASWVAYWQKEREWGVRRYIELLCEGLARFTDPEEQRERLDAIIAGTREILGDEEAEQTITEDGNPLPAEPVSLDWAMECATSVIVDAEDPKDALSIAIRMLQMARLRWKEPQHDVANTNAMVCAVPIVTGLLHLTKHPDFAIPTLRPAAPVPRFVDADPLSPSLVDAYLAWRRVKTVGGYVESVLCDLPFGEEESALCEFTNATSHVEQKHRKVVLSHPAPTGADKLLKLRCLLEYDRDIFDERSGEIAPDLAHLAMLVTIPEPEVVERPETDDDRRDFLTARPDAIPHQPPADLLRLFTSEEGAELFAMVAGYRAAKETGADTLPDLIESFQAYGLYAAWHGGYKMVVPDYAPGQVLTGDERLELGRLGHLSASAIDRLDAASSARQAESEEQEKQAKAEEKAKQSAAERAKYGPPTTERLIPLLPSFSEEARKATSSLLINADMMTTIHGIVVGHADTLQTHELEELRTFDLAALKERFQTETQNIFRQEIDRLLHLRQAAPANAQPAGAQ